MPWKEGEIIPPHGTPLGLLEGGEAVGRGRSRWKEDQRDQREWAESAAAQRASELLEARIQLQGRGGQGCIYTFFFSPNIPSSQVAFHYLKVILPFFPFFFFYL